MLMSIAERLSNGLLRNARNRHCEVAEGDRGNLNSLVDSEREIAALPTTRVSLVVPNDRLSIFSTLPGNCM